jgi:hypothetical protein
MPLLSEYVPVGPSSASNARRIASAAPSGIVWVPRRPLKVRGGIAGIGRIDLDGRIAEQTDMTRSRAPHPIDYSAGRS